MYFFPPYLAYLTPLSIVIEFLLHLHMFGIPNFNLFLLKQTSFFFFLIIRKEKNRDNKTNYEHKKHLMRWQL